MLPRKKYWVTGLQEGWLWLALANLDGSPSAVVLAGSREADMRSVPKDACPCGGSGGGSQGAGGSRRPWEPARPRGHGPSRVTGFVSPIQPRSPSTITSSRTPMIGASPFSLLLSSFISRRWQDWKGFWWEMCFELAYFPLHTMEALSCCVLKVQTKAAQAVFSSLVWSFILPLSLPSCKHI